MNITLNPFGGWRQMATVEVSTAVKDLPALVQDGVLKFQLGTVAKPRRSAAAASTCW